MRLAAFIWISFMPLLPAAAQDMAPDTVLLLRDVTVYSDRVNRFARGQAVVRVDTVTRQQYPGGALSDLLAGSTTAYIRNYGQGTLTTLSLRGSSANHTALLWNGIRVAPPNIGYVDLSLIQGNFFEDISILYGGASPMFGSGSIGGGIHLNNRPIFGKQDYQLDIGLSAGSFQTWGTEGRAQFAGDRVFSRTAFALSGTKNDFSFENFTGKNEKLPHASVFKGGLIQDVAVNLRGEQYLMGSFWFHYADREIPPTMTETASEAGQTDRAWRGMLIWKDFNPSSTLEAKLAYFNEYTLYDDPLTEIYSTIHSQTAAAGFEGQFDVNRRSAVFTGMLFTHEFADLDFYARAEQQQSLAVFASYRYDLPEIQWQASASVRQEFLTGYQAPFLFSTGLDGKIWKGLTGKMSFSRNFRAPTLNERFWQPGGNPEIEPEKSWNLEAGLGFAPNGKRLKTVASVTGYYSRVTDWILWLPGSSFWSVENAQEVWSRGVEILGNIDCRAGKAMLIFSASYTFSKSTNEKKLFDLDASYKKQLIYTPLHRVMVKPGIEFRGFRFILQGNLTGEVFTSKDNTSSLPGYLLLDAFISKNIQLKRQGTLIMLQLNLNNLLDKDYQVVPYRPMPGFNAMATVKIPVRIKNKE